MTTLRAPSMAELVVMLRDLPDGRERTKVEEWYWALAAEVHGYERAGDRIMTMYRWEYEAIRTRRRLEAERLERMRSRPALGASRKKAA